MKTKNEKIPATSDEKKPDVSNENKPDFTDEEKPETKAENKPEGEWSDMTALFMHMPGSRAFFEALVKHQPKSLAELQAFLGEPGAAGEPEGEREAEKFNIRHSTSDIPEGHSAFNNPYSAFSSALSRSLTMLQGYIAGSGDSPEMLDEVVLRLLTLAFDIARGNISPEYVKDAIRARSYEKDVAAARADGEVKGRNMRISQLMEQEERGKEAIPRLAPSAGTQSRSESIFTLANAAR